MKTRLTILSLSPLCFFTFIMNFKFVCQTMDEQALSGMQFICENILTIIILAICTIWGIASIYSYRYFKFLVSFGKNSGYSIKKIEENKTGGLDFFLTLILPLLINDLNEWQNVTTFLLILITIFILLMKTDFFYANPILTILGYHVYKLTFKDNPRIQSQCIAVAIKEITADDMVEYKKITDNVIFLQTTI